MVHQQRTGKLWNVRPALLAMLVLLTAAFGAAPAGAQMGGNIYAAATLSPIGSEEENPASGATFESAPGGTRVRVTVMGQQPGSRYSTQIRDGSCEGAVLYDLQALEADASGEASSVTEILAAVEFGRWYVTVGDEATGGATRLCGVVNPALAAPGAGGGLLPGAGDTPGMPSTGRAEELGTLVALALVGAVASIAVGRRLAVRNRHDG